MICIVVYIGVFSIKEIVVYKFKKDDRFILDKTHRYRCIYLIPGP